MKCIDGRGTAIHRGDCERVPTFTLAFPPYFWYNQVRYKNEKTRTNERTKDSNEVSRVIG